MAILRSIRFIIESGIMPVIHTSPPRIHILAGIQDSLPRSLRKIVFEYTDTRHVYLLPAHKIDRTVENTHISRDMIDGLEAAITSLPELEEVQWDMLTVEGPMPFGIPDKERLRSLFPVLSDRGLLTFL